MKFYPGNDAVVDAIYGEIRDNGLDGSPIPEDGTKRLTVTIRGHYAYIQVEYHAYPDLIFPVEHIDRLIDALNWARAPANSLARRAIEAAYADDNITTVVEDDDAA